MQSQETIKRIHVSFKGVSFYLLSYEELKEFLDSIEGVFKINYEKKEIEIIELDQVNSLSIKMKDDCILEVLLHFHFFFALSSSKMASKGFFKKTLYVIKKEEGVKLFIEGKTYLVKKEKTEFLSILSLNAFIDFELGRYQFTVLREYNYDSINDEYHYYHFTECVKNHSSHQMFEEMICHIISKLDTERLRRVICTKRKLVLRDKETSLTFEFINALSTPDFKALKNILKEGFHD